MTCFGVQDQKSIVRESLLGGYFKGLYNVDDNSL